MSHPITVCPAALRLYIDLANHSPILNSVPAEQVRAVMEQIRTPEHDRAWKAYKRHVQTCQTCRKAINERPIPVQLPVMIGVEP